MKQKMVLKFSMEDERSKKRALKAIAGFEGVDSVAVDRAQNQITVEGDADPVAVTGKLRNFGYTELLSFGPVEEKKEAGDKKPKENEKTEAADKEPKEENPQQAPPPLLIGFPAPPIYYYHCDDVIEQYPNNCYIL